MMDYTELINALREYGDIWRDQLLYEAADAIEELSKPSWIPVTERLPEKNGSYLVYVYGEVTEMNCWHGKWHRFGDDYMKAVTHWMPLPEPPKEETE